MDNNEVMNALICGRMGAQGDAAETEEPPATPPHRLASIDGGARSAEDPIEARGGDVNAILRDTFREAYAFKRFGSRTDAF